MNGDCRKLAKEMETELGLEKGLIHPRKEMANDAAALVHRSAFCISVSFELSYAIIIHIRLV